ASNHTSKPIKLTTERRGQSAPSQFAMLVGSEAVVDFLTDNTKDDESEQPIFVKPGETVEYYRFASLSPQYGINGIFDVESDGELLITFAALIRQEAVESKRSDARMQ